MAHQTNGPSNRGDKIPRNSQVQNQLPKVGSPTGTIAATDEWQWRHQPRGVPTNHAPPLFPQIVAGTNSWLIRSRFNGSGNDGKHFPLAAMTW